jgi:hypothetical protein
MRLYHLLADYNSVIMGTSHQESLLSGTDSSIIDTCTAGNSAQMISYVNGQIMSHDGLCLTGGCHGCYPAQFEPCTNSTSQQFMYSQTAFNFVNAATGLCLDIDAGKGPSVGNWNCTGSTWQQWTIEESSITSKISGAPCLTAQLSFAATAYIYQNSTNSLTFIVNLNTTSAINVFYNGSIYALPNTSVSLIDQNGNVLFNSGTVNTLGLPTERIYEVSH